MIELLQALYERFQKKNYLFASFLFIIGFLIWVGFSQQDIWSILEDYQKNKNVRELLSQGAKHLFYFLILEASMFTIFLLIKFVEVNKALGKAEQILNVEAFYPSNYSDLPRTSKNKVRNYITNSINQIKEQGVPLIICDEKESYAFYKDFAEGTIKIYGTATKPPFYYVSYEWIKDYIKYFRSKDVKRVTILGLDEIQQIIARNIYHIDNSGVDRNRMPEIMWYETVFNQKGKHWWFLKEVPNKFILTDIHHVRTYTNYAVYLVKNNHRLLLNYYERRDKKGFFLLRCISPDDKADEVAMNISSFISELEGEKYNDFYDKFENLVINESRIKDTFGSFKEKNIVINGNTIKVSALLSSKNLTGVDSWKMLFDELSNKRYQREFINRFPQIKLNFGLQTLKI